MVEHLKGYCWLWTMLLLSGRHYSGDLKKVSTVTPPFQARLLEMPFDWIVGNSTASLLCKRKTNPEGRCYDVWRWQRPLLFHTSQHFSFQLRPASLLGQNSDQRGKGLSCRLSLPLLIDFFVPAPPLIWKKAPGRPLARRFLEARARADIGQTHTTISVSLEPICNLHSNEMSSDKLQSKSMESKHNLILRCQKFGFWCSGDLNRWLKFNQEISLLSQVRNGWIMGLLLFVSLWQMWWSW